MHHAHPAYGAIRRNARLRHELKQRPDHSVIDAGLLMTVAQRLTACNRRLRRLQRLRKA